MAKQVIRFVVPGSETGGTFFEKMRAKCKRLGRLKEFEAAMQRAEQSSGSKLTKEVIGNALKDLGMEAYASN